MQPLRPVKIPAKPPQTTASEEDVSLIRGGLFYRAQTVTHLIGADRWNLGRRIVFALAVGWLPLVLITALFNPNSLPALLREYFVYSRMVIAVPVLIAGELLMEIPFRKIVAHVREAGLLEGEERLRFEGMIAALMRLRNSVIPELVLVVAVYANLLMIWHNRLEVVAGKSVFWMAYRVGDVAHLTHAGWYYALVSLPIYQFLIGLTLWKWLLWSIFLFRVSRLELKLEATHPDRRGGLGFIGLSPIGFVPLAFASVTVIGATWRYQILQYGANLMSFKLPAILLCILIVVTALGPLAFFVPKLAALRMDALLQYGTLAQLHSKEFREKWILLRAGHEKEFLSAPEVSTLTDLASSYENINRMKSFIVDKGALIALGLAVVLPILPAILAEIPFKTLLKELLSALK